MHHERDDGSGYPRGLRGEEIFLSARIFAIADTLDAIASNWRYRSASSFESARDIIRECSGNRFDPQVVRAFLAIPEDTWSTIAKNQSKIAVLPGKMRSQLNGRNDP